MKAAAFRKDGLQPPALLKDQGSSQGRGWCPGVGGGLGLCLCLVFPIVQWTISLLSVRAFFQQGME